MTPWLSCKHKSTMQVESMNRLYFSASVDCGEGCFEGCVWQQRTRFLGDTVQMINSQSVMFIQHTNKSLLSLPLATKQLMNNPGEHSNATTKEIDKLDDARTCLISDASASPSIKSRQWLSWPRIKPYGFLCTLVVLMMFAPDTPSRPSLRTSALQPSHIMAAMPST